MRRVAPAERGPTEVGILNVFSEGGATRPLFTRCLKLKQHGWGEGCGQGFPLNEDLVGFTKKTGVGEMLKIADPFLRTFFFSGQDGLGQAG